MIQENDLILVEVPRDSYTHVIINGRLGYVWMETSHEKQLPPGDYDLIGKASDLTEDDWKKAVDQQMGGGKFRYYEIEGTSFANYGSYMLSTATESGLSLLKKHSLEASTTIILKKKS